MAALLGLLKGKKKAAPSSTAESPKPTGNGGGPRPLLDEPESIDWKAVGGVAEAEWWVEVTDEIELWAKAKTPGSVVVVEYCTGAPDLGWQARDEEGDELPFEGPVKERRQAKRDRPQDWKTIKDTPVRVATPSLIKCFDWERVVEVKYGYGVDSTPWTPVKGSTTIKSASKC